MVVFVPNKSSDKTFSDMSSENDKDERHFSDDDENWTKLQDIASRRRIQNRISQRKRSMSSSTLEIAQRPYISIQFTTKYERIRKLTVIHPQDVV
jgi:hypothetical protein